MLARNFTWEKEEEMADTCKSVVLTKIRHMEIKEFPIPEIGADDGLLKVEMVGVCGSDPGYYTGKNKVPFPLMMGHEIVGRIAKIGVNKAKLNNVKVGDRVVVQNRFGCGVCRQCITGNYEKCVSKLGYGVFVPCSEPPYLWGAYSEYLYLPPRAMIHKINNDVKLEAAVLTTSVIGNCIRWVREIGQCSIGETVVIAGAGQQGLAAAVVAKESGAKVILMDIARSKSRLELGKEFGADEIVITDEEDPIEAVKRITDGDLADLFIDCTGYPPMMSMSLDMVKTFGRIVTPGLYGDHPVTLNMDKIVFKQITIRGAHAQSYYADEAAVKLVESRKYPLEKMVTHHFSLEEAEIAVKTAGHEIEGENPIKCVIMPNGPVE